MTFRRTTCPHCRKKLEPGWRIHPGCIDGYAEAQAAKAERARAKAARMAAKVERAETRQRKEAAKRPSEHMAAAQDAFNAFIRARDHDQPCISCGVKNPPMTSGGQWDAGHYLSRGAYPELRFNEDNCHKQCKKCNGGGGRFAHKARTVSEQYRENLIHRIGLERVEALEGPHPPLQATVEDLISIRAHYIQRRKELLKEMA